MGAAISQDRDPGQTKTKGSPHNGGKGPKTEKKKSYKVGEVEIEKAFQMSSLR